MAVPPSPAQVPPPAQVEKQPSTPPPQKVSTTTIILSILLLVVLSTAIVTVIFFDQIAANPFFKKFLTGVPQIVRQNIVQPTIPPKPTAKPTPSYLPPGKQTYVVGRNSVGNVPIIEFLTLDPINVKTGEQQLVEVTISSSTPLQNVSITLYADDKNNQTISLTQSSTNGSSSIWSGTWTIKYSVWYRYIIVITAKNTSGENKAYVAPRTVGPIKKSELE